MEKYTNGTTLIATIREYDEDNGEIIEILYDGDESIILSNGDDPGIGRVPTLDKAADDVWAAWRHWNTFEPCHLGE